MKDFYFQFEIFLIDASNGDYNPKNVELTIEISPS